MKREYRVVRDSKGTIIVLTNYGNRTFKGTAKLADGDEYNEEFGVKLATLRCKQKLFTAKRKVAMMKKEYYEECLKKLTKVLNRLISETGKYKSDCEQYLAEIDKEMQAMLKK